MLKHQNLIFLHNKNYNILGNDIEIEAIKIKYNVKYCVIAIGSINKRIKLHEYIYNLGFSFPTIIIISPWIIIVIPGSVVFIVPRHIIPYLIKLIINYIYVLWQPYSINK